MKVMKKVCVRSQRAEVICCLLMSYTTSSEHEVLPFHTFIPLPSLCYSFSESLSQLSGIHRALQSAPVQYEWLQVRSTVYTSGNVGDINIPVVCPSILYLRRKK